MNIITYIIALTVIIIVEKLTNVSPKQYHEARLTYSYTIILSNLLNNPKRITNRYGRGAMKIRAPPWK
jgi:hypothetical protein